MGQQKKSVQPIDTVGGAGRFRSAVKIGVAPALRMQIFNALARTIMESGNLAELNGVCRTCFGARRLQAAFQAVVAQGAFVRFAVGEIEVDDSERASRQAVDG